MLRSAGAQMDDDVSASYDYDGTLMLDSRNFRGMTSQGVWVVMFYSYTVVIKSKEEAQICQRFTWLWGDLANRYSKMGGETRGGLSPSIHIAKYDASATAERSYVSSLIGSERVEALPAIFIFEGETVRKLPAWEMDKLIATLPDIDRLEGYDENMECDPPVYYYQAYTRNEANMNRLGAFVAGYLADTGRHGISTENEPEPDTKAYSVGNDEDFYDPTDTIMDSARSALDADDPSVLYSCIARMTTVNESDINSRCPLSFQTSLHLAAGAGETGVVKLLLQGGAHMEVADEEGELPLHKAAEAARRGVLRVLLMHGVKIDAPRHSDGATALHLAAYSGNGDVCRLLVREGADLEARTPKGQSPLHFAAMSGYVDETNAIDFLVRLGADVDAQDHMGWTPMMHAIMTYQPTVVEKLCLLGAHVDTRDVAGITALHHAMHYGHEDIVLTLLRHGADPHLVNREGEKAMDVLSRSDNMEEDLKDGELKWSGKHQKTLNSLMLPYRYWYLTPILPAFTFFGPYFRPDYSRKLKVWEDHIILTVKASALGLIGYVRRHWHTFFGVHLLNSNNMSPYHRFTQKRLMEVEEFHDKQTIGGDQEGDVWLYDMGDPEYEMLKSFSELQRAVYFGQVWLARQLLHDGYVKGVKAETSAEADTGQVLIPSIGPDDRGMLRHQGSMVHLEVCDANGSTALMMAVSANNLDMCKLLLDYGAKTEANDKAGWTPLMTAAHTGYLEAMKEMLAHGALPDFGNPVDKKQTALMLAAAQGHLPAVMILVLAGADLDRADGDGYTALNYASSNRQKEVVAWMANKGATMRQARQTQGFEAKLTLQDLGGLYSPADDPEVDARNPRFIGAQ